VYLISITQKSPKKDFVVFAHRGASGLAPENTMIALELAAKNGAKWAECDLQLTKDNAVVIFHDDKVNRTTNGRGYLKALTYDEVAQLDAGSWLDDQFSGVRVPTLAAWLQCAASLGVAQNLELKSVPDEKAGLMAQLLVQHLKDFWPSKMPAPLISSSSLYTLDCLAKEANGKLPLALISDDRISESDMKALQAQGFFSIHHEYGCLNKPYVERLHAHGLQVYAYTVNDPETVEHLRDECGVDGVFTDEVAIYRYGE